MRPSAPGRILSQSNIVRTISMRGLQEVVSTFSEDKRVPENGLVTVDNAVTISLAEKNIQQVEDHYITSSLGSKISAKEARK